MADEQTKIKAVSDPSAPFLEGFRGGDPKARDALARWCLPRVRRTVVLSYGYGPDLDDIVQTAMARVIAGMGSFRGESTFLVWVDRVTINAVRDHFSRNRFRFLFSSDDSPDKDPSPSGVTAPENAPDCEVERSVLLERLSGHFSALKPKLRVVLVLAVLHGYSVAEIAAILDIAFETAKKRLMRARKDLMDRLARDPYCREVLEEMGR